MNLKTNSPGAEPQELPGTRTRWLTAAMLLAAGIIDGGIFLHFATSGAMSTALAIHILLVLALEFGLRIPGLLPDKDIKHFASVATLFVGPPGALWAAWIVARNAVTSLNIPAFDIEEVKSSHDDVENLVQQLRTKRTMRLDAPLPPRFVDVIRTGSLRDRLTVLGLVAQNYHPEYRAVIAIALRSDSTSVRAQAAALITRLAAHYRARLQAAITIASQCANDEQLQSSIAEIIECLHSGTLEPAQASEARDVAISLCRAAQRGESACRTHSESLIELLLEQDRLDDAYEEIRTIGHLPAHLKSRCLAIFANHGHTQKVHELLWRVDEGAAAC